jgi:hypothetical protein
MTLPVISSALPLSPVSLISIAALWTRGLVDIGLLKLPGHYRKESEQNV